MRIINRHAAWFSVVGLYLSLVIHDRNLYPNLSFGISLLLSFLRLFLLLAPVALGLAIAQKKINHFVRVVLILFWLLLLPYTAYSLTEIRHVSELCDVGAKTFYTEACTTQSWTLAPVFVYASAGMLAFVFSLSQVAAHLFAQSFKKQTFILALCAYCAVATASGLYTRVNIWSALLHPISFLETIAETWLTLSFAFNSSIFFLFFASILFVTNRILRHAGKYIP